MEQDPLHFFRRTEVIKVYGDGLSLLGVYNNPPRTFLYLRYFFPTYLDNFKPILLSNIFFVRIDLLFIFIFQFNSNTYNRVEDPSEKNESDVSGCIGTEQQKPIEYKFDHKE
jgi:hypothetical protein